MSLELIYKHNKSDYLVLKQYLLLGGATKSQSNTIISEKDLISYIEDNTKSSFSARYEDDGKLSNIIANNGLSSGELAIREGGEYNGLVIRALEDIKPILTDTRIVRGIKHLMTGDIQKAIGVLRLTDEVYEYSTKSNSTGGNSNGIGLIYAVLQKWLDINDIPIPKEYIDKASGITLTPNLIKWIESFNWAPILGRFEIVEIGHNKNYSIVPESWIGRVFDDANQLHLAMDKLEWRKGKPPVNFCAIYAMDIKTVSKIYTLAKNKSDTDLINAKVRIGMKMFVTKGVIRSDINIFSSAKEYKTWYQSLPLNCNILMFDLHGDNFDKKISIAFNYNELFEATPIYQKKRSVGLLVSTLQKLLRRGPTCSKALTEVLTELWRSPAYNLPEQQFFRVNACRQLAWRLFITSIEDVRAFTTTDNSKVLIMPDLAILAAICNGYLDTQFNQFVFDKLLLTALNVQRINKKWDALNHVPQLKQEIPFKDQHNNFLNAFVALQYYMPTREWDYFLLQISFNFIHKGLNPDLTLDIMNTDRIYDQSNDVAGEDAMLAGCDMHPFPNLLLVFQGSLPFIPYDPSKHTTLSLWNFIWDYSSAVNFRLEPKVINSLDQQMLDILKNIQRRILYFNVETDSIIKLANKYPIYPEPKNTNIMDKIPITTLTKRTAFILLFGQKRSYIYKKKRYDIIIAGHDFDDPNSGLLKVKYLTNNNESKYLEGDLRLEIEQDFLKDFADELDDVPDAPLGFKWIWPDTKKITIRADTKDKIRFFVNDVEIKAYDASNVLVRLPKIKPIKTPTDITHIIKRATYQDLTLLNTIDDYQINILMRELHEKNYPLFDWIDLVLSSNLPNDVWRSIYVKLFNNKENEILIGPVDGRGHALRDSINYLYEGTIWRIFNMFSMLYPKAIKTTNAVKSLKFKIDRSTSQYLDLIRCLNNLTFRKDQQTTVKSVDNTTQIKIKTKLWPHQQSTVTKILQDIDLGKKGLGDASNVGAGKTLTALAVMAGLYTKLYTKSKSKSNSSFLVLLPTTHLFKTWKDEIEKHCQGYLMVFQEANGDLTSELKSNSILITTLGRMRDHPINQSWIFVVIDECLSVQNKNALQTEEAWKQIIVSQFGVLMMSATFFRTRFDKLFYMIKMLNTGLPENKKYLDAILAESIVLNIPIKTREWISTYHPFDLIPSVRKLYDELLDTDLNSDKLYIKLQTFLFDNFDYVSAFQDVINKCTKDKRRCLVYAKSKHEADLLSTKIKNLSRFPDLTGRHLVISYTEGTYGLNNLIYLDTIITRFPEPDKLPQMKGRLDRPNQLSNILHIEYIYIQDTIDRGGMIRLEMANNFYNDYLMPLAEFYEISLGKTKSKS